MSDKVNGFFVVLENDIKDEQIDLVKNLFRNVRGVLDVTENIDDGTSVVSRMRAESRIREALFKLIKEEL